MNTMNKNKWERFFDGSDTVRATAEQLQAMKSDKSLTVVSAGAGTGKTHTLSRRFCWLIANDANCKADEILVLTFTKKAAEEMRSRIKKDLLALSGAEYGAMAHVKRAAEQIEEAYISTIDSFAMRLIKESGLDLDIDPVSSIMPPSVEKLWWEKLCRNLSYMDLNAISDEFSSIRDIDELKSILNRIHPRQLTECVKTASEKLSAAGITPDALFNWDNSDVSIRLKEKRAEAARAIYTEWKNLAIPVLDTYFEARGKKSLNQAETKLACLVGKFKAVTEESDELCCELSSEMDAALYGVKSNAAVMAKAVLPALGYNREELKRELDSFSSIKIPTDEETETNSLLCRFTAVCWKAWNNYRSSEHVLSFADLLYYASRVLDASSEYKKKFKHIMIDEFQDTNPLQDSFVKKLRNPGYNTLFIVGDTKQSIYRFRNADVSLFADYTEQCKKSADAANISLDTNFRTVPGLLDKFHTVFGDMWRESKDIQYQRLKSPAANGKQNSFDDDMELIIIRDDKKLAGEKRTTAQEKLFFELGSRFADIRKTGKFDWKDFAILARRRKEFSSAERVFERMGIPYVVCSSKAYYSRSDVGDIINLLKLLCEPENALYLAGFLASPFSGLSQSETEQMLCAAVDAPLAEIVKKNDVWDYIEKLRRIAQLSGASAVIYEIMKSPTYLLHFSDAKKIRTDANLKFMANLISDYERYFGHSLKGCADYLAIAARDAHSQEDPEFFDEETNAVRLMTVHASKGLEFPITAVLYSSGGKADISPLTVSKNYGIVIKSVGDGDTQQKAVLAELEKDAEKAEELEELKRLWYVAFTRAKEKLIFCTIWGEKDKRIVFAEKGEDGGEKSVFTEEDFCRARLTGCPASIPEDRVLKIEPFYTGLPAAADKRDAAVAVAPVTENPARLAKITASAYSLISWCPKAYRAVYRQGRKIEYMVKGGEEHGAEFGSMLHRILAVWKFTEEDLAALLPAENNETVRFAELMQRMPEELKKCYGAPEMRKKAWDMLSRYVKTAECAALAQLESKNKLVREAGFRVRTDFGPLMVGASDMFWEDEAGIHIRDWKSSSEQYAPSGYYEHQLEFYAYALKCALKKQSSGNTPVDAALLYLRDNPEERKIVKYTDADIALIGRKIEAASITALSGRFDAQTENCRACPWKSVCDKHIGNNQEES